MKGRLNEETGYFEVFYNNDWHGVDEYNWSVICKRISLEFIMTLCYNADKEFKKRAFCELSCRIRNDFNLNELWILFSQGSRLAGDLAADEIFKRSGNRYCLPIDRNR